jgi:hypothetical protein
MRFREWLAEAGRNLPGVGDEETWARHFNHPLDPRTDDGGEDSDVMFNDHVVVPLIFYNQNGQEVPIQVEVYVEAERQRRSVWSPSLRRIPGKPVTPFTDWEFDTIKPIAVKVGGKTGKWEDFIRMIPDDDNEELKRPSIKSLDWQQWLREVMPSPGKEQKY